MKHKNDFTSLGAVMLSILIFLVIFVCNLIFTSSLFFFLRNSMINYLDKIVVIIQLVSVVLTIFFSYKLLVYEEKRMTPEEIRLQRIEDRDKDRKQVLKRLEISKIYSPSKSIYDKDVDRINGLLKNFFKNEYFIFKKDSSMGDRLNNFLNWNINTIDSTEFKLHFQTIFNSIAVDKIFYSPDLKRLIVFVSYNEEFKGGTGANTYVFIGIREGNSLKLYEFYYSGYSTIYNQDKDISFLNTFLFLTKIGNTGQTCPLLTSEFWDCEYIFKVHSFEDNLYYSFQRKKNSQSGHLEIIEPLFELK